MRRRAARLLCVFGRHAALPGEIRNQGFGFSRCGRCGCDMVRSNRTWARVPKGFRVVWKHPAAKNAGVAVICVAAKASTPLAPYRKSKRGSATLDLVLAALRYLIWTGEARLRAYLIARTGLDDTRPVTRLIAP